MYEIQDGVPLPPVNHAPEPRRRKYPFESMDVGAMFFVPNKTTAQLASYVSSQGKDLGKTFETRTVWMIENDNGWAPAEADDENATKGVGVWRTK